MLRGGQSSRTGTDDGYFLAGANFRGLGMDPAFGESALHDIFFDLLDGDGRLVDAQHARRFARRGTDASGEFGEIIGRVQLAYRALSSGRDRRVVPVGNEIVDRASGLTERDAAIHAARALCAQFLFGEVA